MKEIFLLLSFMGLVLVSSAQTIGQARLALVCEAEETMAVGDVLTAELSGNAKLQLLERNEIQKVFREQNLSASNHDYLKLGQILGADGLVWIELAKEGTNKFLNLRLLAVNPGVVLVVEKYPWPLRNAKAGALVMAKHLELFLPKLKVLAKDAIPISVVNFRSSISSAEALEAERQLKLLILQRLTHVPQFFVLERQKMNLLGDEKDLKSDDSPFWSGSYLLEGVVDPSGYSKEILTVKARLLPPKGGSPVQIEVSGGRTNLTEVVDKLAAQIIEGLKISYTPQAWNPAAEASQYFEEAKWALEWRIWAEAQSASESAWALGKRDLACAMLRIRAYLNALPNLLALNVLSSSNGNPGYRSVHMEEMPDPADCDTALKALEYYYAFNRTSPEGMPEMLSQTRQMSAWYQLGIDNLIGASHVLQHFNFVPESQKSSAKKLGELRALARLVAGVIENSSSVHDSFFVGNRMVTHDELYNTMSHDPNLFQCMVNWGCYWQETPEDTLTLYRELLSNPVFCYLHKDLWFREHDNPRLVAWNENDRRRLGKAWNGFLLTLEASTNVFSRMESKAMKLTDASDRLTRFAAATNFFGSFLENHGVFISHNVEVLYDNWDVESLIERVGWILPPDEKSVLENLLAEFMKQLETKKGEREQFLKDHQSALLFEKQKQFLQAQRPFQPGEFFMLFDVGYKDYSKSQALEIIPLLDNYRTNLSGNWALAARDSLNRLEKRAKNAIDSTHGWKTPAPHPQMTATLPTRQSNLEASLSKLAPPTNKSPEIVTNVLTINKFLEIPLNGLQGDEAFNFKIVFHQWFEGKLLLEIQYEALFGVSVRQGMKTFSNRGTYSLIAILDPPTEHWEIIPFPEEDTPSPNICYHRSALLRGEVFISHRGKLKKYDFNNRRWLVLDVSTGTDYNLFPVNGRLYAADATTILEILDDGKSARILASNRRQPTLSLLDSQDLKMAALFEGPGHSLRISTKKNIYTWNGSDWREDAASPPASFQPSLFSDGLIFRQSATGSRGISSISYLGNEISEWRMCFGQRISMPKGPDLSRVVRHAAGPLDAQWELPRHLNLEDLPAALRQSDLYLLVDHAEIQDVADDQHNLLQSRAVARDGYHAAMLRFSPGFPLPQKLFLKFEAPNGCAPVTGVVKYHSLVVPAMPPVWMLFTTNYLICGLEKPNSFQAHYADWTQRLGYGYKVGVWMIPIAQIDAAISAEKEIQIQQLALTAAAKKQTQQTLLAKYDRNHDGTIDRLEKAEALDDAGFIESEWDAIAGKNLRWLDGTALAFFDADQTKTLEPKEQAGIEIAQNLLAKKLLISFDDNEDGQLDQVEFNDMLENSTQSKTRLDIEVAFPDSNRDGYIDLEDLEAFLVKQTLRNLHYQEPRDFVPFGSRRRVESQPMTPRQFLKTALEAYWRNPDGATNNGAITGNNSPGGFRTNRIPQSLTR